MVAKKGIKLHIIISLLILFIIICTVSINLLISMNTHKKSLTENYLNSNYNYAKKVASSTESQLNYMLKNLIAMGSIAGNKRFHQDNLDTWHDANSDQFNTMFTMNERGIIQLISRPFASDSGSNILAKGTKLQTDAIKKALADKEPLISAPYYAVTGQLITLISAPIFDKKTGDYKGIVGGTIYMDHENVLHSILGTHEYDDSSYVYVVDQEGNLIYHPDTERLGEDVSANEVVRKVMNGKAGSNIATNTEGIEYFTGFSSIESTGWGIVSQTPTSIIDKPLTDLFWRMVILSVPFLLLILIIGGFVVSTITKPIKILADFSRNAMREVSDYQDVIIPDIHSPVYEVRQLYYQGIEHLRMLNQQVKMDGLTEIANRRMLDDVINLWMEKEIPFSLIMLDIDQFKKVNDTYGHLVGDEVLKDLAKKMVAISRKEDLCFRYGGEEFGILVKDQDLDEAYELAEKLRTTIANTPSPTGEPITVSFGITAYQYTDQNPEVILSRADEALYHSKRTGRNKTTVYSYENIA